MLEFSQLRQALEAIAPLADESWGPIESFARGREYRRGDLLLRAGDRADHIFFLLSGVLREFYVTVSGEMATRRFCLPGQASGSLLDLLSGQPSITNIEALEDCRVIVVPYAEFDRLTMSDPKWLLIARRIAEGLYIRKARREFEMLTMSAAERYRCFETEFPGLEARVPQHVVASYLGITPVHFSRLKRSGKSRS